jgi:hypothetical protein
MAAALTTKSPTADDFPAFYTAAQHPGAVYGATNSGIGGNLLPWLRIPSYARILQPRGALPFLRSRRAALDIAPGVAAHLGLSFAIEPDWVGHYLAVLRSSAPDPEPLKMIGIRSLASALPFSGIVYSLGFAALMFWLWRIAADAPIVDGVSRSLAIGLIAALHCWTGCLALFALSPLPFLAILPGATRVTALLGGELLVFSTCVVLQYSIAVRRAEASARQQRACPAAS